ncbi:MAG: acyl--CoA ligase [Candidatus Methylomirabilis sp.]|nr:acyl--CoA ligase [Deltaproteobacteria bacterium]
MTHTPNTIASLFETSVSKNGSSPIIIFDDGSSLSYSEAGVLAKDVAGRLQAAGIMKGDRVVSISRASAEAAVVFWASALAGAVFVPVDYALSTDALPAIIKRAGPKIIFLGRESTRSEEPAGIETISYGPESDPRLKSFSAWLDEGGKDYRAGPVSPEDDAAILFTSGTSGLPKGVVLSNAALCGSGRLVSEVYGWTGKDRILCTGDFHTMSGLRNPCVAALRAGSSFIIAPENVRKNAAAASELMEKTGTTVLCTVPAFLAQFVLFPERVSSHFVKELRLVMCTGSSLPESMAEKFEMLFGRPVLNYYGLTETAGFCIGVPPGRELDFRGTIGIPAGCATKIIASGGREAAEGETGELFIKTENLMSGYFGEPEATAEVVKDGWYKTADLCRTRPDGSIELIGRADDAFKDARGELVHPAQIERAIESSPLVIEAAVCALGAEGGRPVIEAFVVPRNPSGEKRKITEELKRHCLAVLGHNRTPADFRLVDSLPRGTNGKLLRRKLKEACL